MFGVAGLFFKRVGVRKVSCVWGGGWWGGLK